jgi:TolA-binding protein
MIKTFISFFIISFAILNAKEISAFGAGDINSANPYGLTKAEKAVLKNSDKIKSLQKKLNSYISSQEDLTQTLEGIKSVYENDSKNIYKTKNNLKNIQDQIKTDFSSFSKQIIENEQRISVLEKKLDDFITLQKQNNKFVEEKLIELATAINKINTNYVREEQFNELVQFVNKKRTTQKSVKKTASKVDNAYKKSDKDLMAYAKALYKKNYITKSLPYFQKLIEKKYKPAENNFYVGKIYFYKKKYKNAIHHFKTSMMLYDQAQWIPELLLLSAISFEKTGDKENAINFYSTLVDAYPETKESKTAKKNLAKLQ